MILKLALRNIIGNGWRSLINIFILSLVLTAMIWMQTMYHSWIKLAITQTIEWQMAEGQFHHKDYDRFDPFSWDESNAPIPAVMQPAISEGKAFPILLSQAVIYPQGRMQPVVVRGIPPEQQLLKIPAEILAENDDFALPALIGKSMARSSRLQEGDIITMRLKDAAGSFNALDLRIAKIMDSPVAGIDAGNVWIALENLQEVKGLPGNASIIVIGDEDLAEVEHQDWRFVSLDEMLADLYKILETERMQEHIIYALLLFLAMIAIFDTQILALFKRRREIGTLSAMGMTKGQIIRLFTTEGVLYLVFAVGMTAIIGTPVFIYFARVGFRMPEGFEEFEMIGMTDAVKFVYQPQMIIGTILFLLGLTAVVSWLPTLRIARMKPTDALRGKVN